MMVIAEEAAPKERLLRDPDRNPRKEKKVQV
jgi:hypothetical protein